jgi:uncharacterized membrane protein HdeD (DUF308 family)
MKHKDARVFLATGGVLVAGGVALFVLVASALRSGTLDTRAEHAPVSEPEWILAAQEPFWFYGIIALVSIFAAYLLVHGSRMIRESRGKR